MIVAAILQSTLIPEIRIGEAGPDLILILVVTWTLLAGFESAVWWALPGGVLSDLLSGTPIGATALALVVVSFAISTVPGQVSKNNLIIPPLVMAAATLLYHGILMIVLRLTGTEVAFVYTITQVSAPSAVYNLVLLLPVFRVIGGLYETYRPRRIGEP
jgi:rod shape-determining protein MreD